MDYIIEALRELKTLRTISKVNNKQTSHRAINEKLLKKNRRTLQESMSWQEIKDSLKASIDAGEDPLYTDSEAGDTINTICQEIEEGEGIVLEPSIEAGRGSIFIYRDDEEVGCEDYEVFNNDVIDLALESNSVDEFKSEYNDYLCGFVADAERYHEIYHYWDDDDEWDDDEDFDESLKGRKHKPLKEVYSPSMPSWLVDRLNQTWDPRNSHKNFKGYYDNGGLSDAFLLNHIDLNNVEVFTAPKPTKTTSRLLTKRYIPILLFDNGQVYAKGINGSEKFELDPDKKPFEKIAYKDLLDQAKDFCYIDKSLDSTSNKAKQQARNDIAYDRSLIRHQVEDENGKFVGSGFPFAVFDRSGYETFPDKYKYKLAKLKATKAAEILSRSADSINEYRKKFASILQDDTTFDSRAVAELAKLFNNLLLAYDKAKSFVEAVLNSDASEDRKQAAFEHSFKGYGEMNTLEDALRDFNKACNKYKA